MAYESEARFRVLHALRLKGFADTEGLVPSTGLRLDEVASHLGALLADELVIRREGRMSGWSLTPAGRKEHAVAVVDELDVSGTGAAVTASYQRFLTMNADLLGVCTSWQVRDVDGSPSVNDHADPAYDASVVDALAALHDRGREVTTGLAGTLQRFVPYGDRFATALGRVQAGEHEWFTRPVIDSYHTVWFELHEDLLATLGRERATEIGQSS